MWNLGGTHALMSHDVTTAALCFIFLKKMNNKCKSVM